MADEKTESGVSLGTAEMANEGSEDVKLSVYPIYKAYLKAIGGHPQDAMRLTFLELQYRAGFALTWPDIK